MNILVAPNSMKGSLHAPEFARAVEIGFRQVSKIFNVRCKPIADGGDYTGNILSEALGAKSVHVRVHDPLGREIMAEMGISGDTAVVEMASASGMRLLEKSELNPERTSSAGTGEMILHAVRSGCRKILLGVGGSATVDGGIGLLSALGFGFLDQKGRKLPGTPGSLSLVRQIDFPADWNKDTEIYVLCDVRNPLLGPEGAARVFAPQKGADEPMVERLEESLGKWADTLEEISGKDIRDIPGMGAAGGIATGLFALLNARMVPGAEYVFRVLDMESHIDWADWVITGEGKIDSQSEFLKAPHALASLAKTKGKPVLALAGIVEDTGDKLFDGIFAIANGPMSVEESTLKAAELVSGVSGQIARILLRSNPRCFDQHLAAEAAEACISGTSAESAEKYLAALSTNLPARHYLEGLLEKKRQNWGAAINGFLKALEIDPGFTPAKLNIELVRNIMNFVNPSLRDP